MMKITLLFCLLLSAFAFAQGDACDFTSDKLKKVKDSIFQFNAPSGKACFFSYYTDNEYKSLDMKGCGNPGDTIWYAFSVEKGKVTHLPKPSEEYKMDWQILNKVEAVSFIDVNSDGNRDITIIASNDHCAYNIFRPIVFLSNGNEYKMDVDILPSFYGYGLVSVSDVKSYYEKQQTKQRTPNKSVNSQH